MAKLISGDYLGWLSKISRLQVRSSPADDYFFLSAFSARP